ncbi:MAG: aminotransferase class V-fold PLP-dependent enzyme, partial [Vicinamibacterales bacterium]
HDRLWPSSYSAYPGAVGISRKIEAYGQRDEATMIALREALAFQTKIGRADIEKRSRALAQQLMAGISKIDGFKIWTSPMPERSVAVVSFQPGTLDSRKLLAALYENDKIAVTSRGGTDRSGLRVSPHFYNTPDEVDRLVGALTRYQKTGV